jgi:hypothetical protein
MIGNYLSDSDSEEFNDIDESRRRSCNNRRKTLRQIIFNTEVATHINSSYIYNMTYVYYIINYLSQDSCIII